MILVLFLPPHPKVFSQRKMAAMTAQPEFSEVECPLCLYQYNENDRCPRILLCGHTFCTACLATIIRRDKGTITCPKDKQKLKIGRSGSRVSSDVSLLFSKNYAILDLVCNLKNPDISDDDSFVLCEVCCDDEESDVVEEDSSDEEYQRKRDSEERRNPKLGHAATHCCLECSEKMCQKAAQVHKKMKISRSHHVTLLSDAKKVPESGIKLICEEHGDPFRFYDEDCKTPICTSCALLNHQGHQRYSLQNMGQRERSDIKDLLKKTKKKAHQLLMAGGDVLETQKKLDSNFEQQNQTIRSAFDEITRACESREEELLSTLAEFHRDRKVTLSSQLKALDSFQKLFSSAANRLEAGLTLGNEIYLMSLSAEMQENLSLIKPEVLPLTPEVDDLIMDVAIDHRKILSVCQTLGSLEGGSDVSSSQPKISLRGQGIKVAILNQKASFFLASKDVSLNRLKVQIQNYDWKTKIEKRDDGVVAVCYQVPFVSSLALENVLLSVTTNQNHIPGSPFPIRVLENQLDPDDLHFEASKPIIKHENGKSKFFSTDGSGVRAMYPYESGKVYWEVSSNCKGSSQLAGLATAESVIKGNRCTTAVAEVETVWGYNLIDGKVYHKDEQFHVGKSKKKVGFEFDMDEGTLHFWIGGKRSERFSSGLSGKLFPFIYSCCSATWTVHFAVSPPY